MYSLTLHNPCLTASLHPHKCPRSLAKPIQAGMIRKGSVALRLDGFPRALKNRIPGKRGRSPPCDAFRLLP